MVFPYIDRNEGLGLGLGGNGTKAGTRTGVWGSSLGFGAWAWWKSDVGPGTGFESLGFEFGVYCRVWGLGLVEIGRRTNRQRTRRPTSRSERIITLTGDTKY